MSVMSTALIETVVFCKIIPYLHKTFFDIFEIFSYIALGLCHLCRRKYKHSNNFSIVFATVQLKVVRRQFK